MTNATMTNGRAIASQGAAELGPRAAAADVLAWAAATFGDGMIVASRMQDAVLVDLASRALPGVRVLFLDTGYHFAETIGTRDAVGLVYDVEVVNARARRSVAQQDAEFGKDLWARDPNRCCALRKVEPLRETLAAYSAWITGVRRVDASTRTDAPLVSWDEKFGLVKVNPIAAWTDEEVGAYLAEHGVLVNPLVGQGYPSIGCEPCTARPAAGADPRSGRWAGTGKIECGLHA